VIELSNLSPMTLSVTRPAARATTATVIDSPGLYSGLSRAISSMSGVSALASVYQPASKPIAVVGPRCPRSTLRDDSGPTEPAP
jgi:hypothetical protein